MFLSFYLFIQTSNRIDNGIIKQHVFEDNRIFLCSLLYNYLCNVCHVILSAIVCDNPIISLLIITLSPLIGNPINLQALFKGYMVLILKQKCPWSHKSL